jgi:four helix bundle protein
MRYSEWIQSVPASMQDDSLWKMAAYRYAMFLSDIAWTDATKLKTDVRTIKLSGQLYGAIGSIGANLAEGYSRGTGKDRARFYEYALGSGRESRTWYFDARHLLSEQVFTHRADFIGQIIKLILTMIPEQRHRGSATLREDSPLAEETMSPESYESQMSLRLLEDIPFSQ